MKFILKNNQNNLISQNHISPIRGFTIVELLMYMAIFSILILVLLQLFNSILDIQLESQATSTVSQDGEYILTRLTYDLKRAQSITIPSSPGITSDNLEIVIDQINYLYALNNGNLIITAEGSTNVLNGYDTSVSNLNFTRIGDTDKKQTIMIAFNLTSKTARRSGYEMKGFRTIVSLR